MTDEFDTDVVASFAPDRYGQILELMCDRALLPPSYRAWRLGFEERVAVLRRRAVTPIVVEIEPDAFWAWCTAGDWPCDALARMEYAERLAAVGHESRILPAVRVRAGLAEASNGWPRDACADSTEPLQEAAA